MADNWRKWLVLLALSVMGVGFFLLYSVLVPISFQSSGSVRLNSPDETANYWFARDFAETREIGYVESLAQVGHGHIHPRSMTTVGDRVVPVGFLGMVVWYGIVAMLVGVWVLPWLTPFLAVLGGFAWMIIVRRIFDSRAIGFVAGVLVLLHPAYWYNAARAFLPNVPFIALLLVGIALIIEGKGRVRWMAWLAGGFLVGVALTMRLSELPWVAMVLAVLALCTLRNRGWMRSLVAFCAGLIPLAGLFVLNVSIYGTPIVGGYQIQSLPSLQRFNEQGGVLSALPSEVSVGALLGLLKQVKAILMPFGYDPVAIAKNFSDYGVGFFPLWSAVTVLGVGVVMAVLIRRGGQRAYRAMTGRVGLYAFVSAAVAAWLVFFYGSWVFHDNISLAVSIGNSYLRYWLPGFILTTPLIAYVLVWAVGTVQWRRVAAAVIIGAVAAASAHSVYRDAFEGIEVLSQTLSGYHVRAAELQGATPDDAVIVSARSDKVIVPERKAAVIFEPFREASLIAPVVAQNPVFYYGAWRPEELPSINQRYFAPYGLQLIWQLGFADGMQLYRLEAGK